VLLQSRRQLSFSRERPYPDDSVLTMPGLTLLEGEVYAGLGYPRSSNGNPNLANWLAEWWGHRHISLIADTLLEKPQLLTDSQAG
jgi:hypothetical protein